MLCRRDTIHTKRSSYRIIFKEKLNSISKTRVHAAAGQVTSESSFLVPLKQHQDDQFWRSFELLTFPRVSSEWENDYIVIFQNEGRDQGSECLPKFPFLVLETGHLFLSLVIDEFHIILSGHLTPFCFLPVINNYQIVRNTSLWGGREIGSICWAG